MIVLLAIFIFPVLVYAQPEIKFDTETYDMGEVTKEIAMHSFGFKNAGSAELVIEKLASS